MLSLVHDPRIQQAREKALGTRLEFNSLVPRVSHLTVPWSLRDPGNEVTNSNHLTQFCPRMSYVHYYHCNKFPLNVPEQFPSHGR